MNAIPMIAACMRLQETRVEGLGGNHIGVEPTPRTANDEGTVPEERIYADPHG